MKLKITDEDLFAFFIFAFLILPPLVVGGCLYLLWQVSPLLSLSVVLAVILIGGTLYLKERWRRHKEGWWLVFRDGVEWDLGPDRFGISYYEGKEFLEFYGYEDRKGPTGKRLLMVPFPEAWEDWAPRWAQDKRAVIFQRLAGRYELWEVLEPHGYYSK